MQATKKKYYWSEYIRNEQSMWIGEHTESLISQKIILNKLDILKKKWTVISSISKFIAHHPVLNISSNYCFSPDAQDIIPFVLLKIKEKKTINYQNNNINYLYDFF